jgi:hypothetical protein
MYNKEYTTPVQTYLPKKTYKVLNEERGEMSMSAFLANLLIIYTEAITGESVLDDENNNVEMQKEIKNLA